MRSLIIFAALAVAAASNAQWVLHTSGYPWNYLSTTSYETDVAELWNEDYEDSLAFTLSGSDYYWEIVHGSTESAPWTSKFTPITSMPTERKTRSWSYSGTLAPRHWGKVRLSYSIEDGSETWINESTAVIAQRVRSWWTATGSSTFTTYPIP